MSNYKVLFSLRTLKSILQIFVESFLVLYFLQLSNNNILPLGIYKLISMTVVYLVIFSVRNFCKSKHRVILMRIGIILDFVYFLSIILLKEKMIDYIYLVGVLYGLEEGFYFSVYNMLESDGISNEERTKFVGTYTSLKHTFAILFPLIFGSTIYTIGFTNSLFVVLLIIVLRIILSMLFKDVNIPKSNKTDIKKYIQIVKSNKKIKQMLKVNFFNGLTYSEGAFLSIVTIYIIKIFSNSFSLGVFTSIFSVIACLIGILFARFIQQKHYKHIIKISMTFTVISLCVMIYKCNMITVILFNLCQTFSRNLMELINSTSTFNIANIEILKKEFKVEYFLSTETALFIGRVISNLIFILMAFTNMNIIIYVFAIILIIFARNSMKLQKIIEEEEKQINNINSDKEDILSHN